MIIKGNRQEEVLTRAKNRSVTAIINMYAPDIDPKIKAEQFGLIIEDKKPSMSLTVAQPFAQASHVWQQNDTCDTLAEKDPKVLYEVLEAIGSRTKGIDSHQLNHLAHDEQKVVFNSEDLIDRANGIPTRLSLKFKESSEATKHDILALPFAKLQFFLLHLQDRLEEIGGKLHSAYIGHSSSMTAFDYYEISTQKYVPGKKLSYGDVMLNRAYNLLGDIGIPLVSTPRSTLN